MKTIKKNTPNIFDKDFAYHILFDYWPHNYTFCKESEAEIKLILKSSTGEKIYYFKKQ